MNGKTKQSRFDSLGLAWRVALVCAVLFSSSGVRAQLVSKAFSADQVTTTREKTKTAKVYATPTAMRAEGVEDGKKYVTIIRFDRKVMWALMPDEKIYYETLVPSAAPSGGDVKKSTNGAQVRTESLGSEQVGGFHCDKTRTTMTWEGITGTTIEWAAKELGGFVVKKQDVESGEITEYKNIRLGPQDPSLFELPAGYKKMSM